MIEGAFFQGWRGQRRWFLSRRVDDPIAGVLLVHGYSEHSGRYRHVIDAFADRGLTVFAPDLPGHGRSARVPGDLESVDAVLGDLGVLGDKLERAVQGRPLYVVAHSMGALLSLVLLGRESRWAGAVLNGTALEVPENIPQAIQRLAPILGRVAPLLPVQPFYDATRSSRDPAVAAASLADPFQYKGWIRARTGTEVMKAQLLARETAPHLRIPLLLTHGGDDRTVPVSASADLHTRLGSVDKELQIFPGLLHEVHQEPERDAVIARWGIWVTRRARALG